MSPPDLNEVARPLAVSSPQRCGDAVSASTVLPGPPTDKGGEGHQPSGQFMAKGSGGNDDIAEVKATAPTTSIVKYFMTPSLADTFAAVGATNNAYSFKEILGFLKAYLYKNRHLFDVQDILYVNCRGDPLGDALKVDRFHYNDVRLLIAKYVTREPKQCLENLLSKEQLFSLNGHSNEASANNTLNVKNIESANGKTFSKACTWNGTHNSIEQGERERRGVLAYPSVPGPSYQTAEGPQIYVSTRERRRTGSLSSIVEIPVPSIPDSNSDSESVYSYQGYETAYCRNTEYEESEEDEEVIEYEEYELASDDDEDQAMRHSDDNDSIIEDVEVAVLALHALYEDELEENCWADDSDSGEQSSTDEDPDLVLEKWACVTCGVRNLPFVRYCAKCWQLRKNWLPERPSRRRKRKPRSKKKYRTNTDSNQSGETVVNNKNEAEVECIGEDCDEESDEHVRARFDEDPNDLVRVSSTSSWDSGHSDLVRTSSTATTVSMGNVSPRSSSFDQFSSQDSGICLLQDTATESSQGSGMADEESPCCSKLVTRPETEVVGVSKSNVGGVSDTSQKVGNKLDGGGGGRSSNNGESSSRKRSSVTKEESKAKRIKSSSMTVTANEETETCSMKDVLDKMNEKMNAEFLEYIRKNKGKDWTPNWKEVDREVVISVSKNTTSDVSNSTTQMCLICCSRPKNAIIIHGRLSHQATCYQCARRLLDTGSRCPVCRRKIHMVCKNIIV